MARIIKKIDMVNTISTGINFSPAFLLPFDISPNIIEPIIEVMVIEIIV